MLSDTDPLAGEVQTELLRQASPAQRLALTRSLSRTVIGLSRRAMARANPSLSAVEIDLLFVEIHYGQEIARSLERTLAKRDE